MRTRRSGEEALAQAVDVGAQLFAERGFSETTTRQLSAAMGVTNGTFYHHFPSKEDLLRRICEEALADITEAVTDAVTEVEEPAARVEALITTHVAVITRSSHLHTTMLTELRSLSGANHDAVVGARDRYSQVVREVLADARAAGELRDDIDANALTLLLLNLLNWTIFWYEPGRGLTPEALAGQMVTLFLDGARSRI